MAWPEVCWQTGQMFMHELQRMQWRGPGRSIGSRDLALRYPEDQVELLRAIAGVTPVHMEVGFKVPPVGAKKLGEDLHVLEALRCPLQGDERRAGQAHAAVRPGLEDGDGALSRLYKKSGHLIPGVQELLRRWAKRAAVSSAGVGEVSAPSMRSRKIPRTSSGCGWMAGDHDVAGHEMSASWTIISARSVSRALMPWVLQAPFQAEVGLLWPWTWTFDDLGDVPLTCDVRDDKTQALVLVARPVDDAAASRCARNPRAARAAARSDLELDGLRRRAAVLPTGISGDAAGLWRDRAGGGPGCGASACWPASCA